MHNNPAHDMSAWQKVFIGAIIASFTHELKNHLAIIKESSGLQQDIIAMDRKVKDTSGVVKFLQSVDGQVDKSLRLISYLNRFSHRMDTETTVFSPNEALDELIALTMRLADQRMLTLSKDFDRSIETIASNPAMLQMVVFFLLDEKIGGLDRRGAITVRTTSSAGGFTVSIVPAGARAVSGEREGRCPREVLHEAARRLSASLTMGEIEQESILVINTKTQA